MLGLGNSVSSLDYTQQSGAAASGFSMSFDGAGDYLSFTETTFPIGDDGDKFSISFWAKRDTTATSEDAVITNVNGYKRRINFDTAGSKLYIEGDTNGQSTYAVVTADTNWHHYIITSNNDNGTGTASTTTAYEDGAAVAVTAINFGVAAGASDGDMTVNSLGSPSGGGATGFDGLLYQIAIYNEIIDAAAATAMYNSGTPIPLEVNNGDYDNSGDLLHLWNFSEGVGSSSADSAGSLTTTLQGDAIFSTTTPS
tara:strand:+ start:426 stop:1187 length:762 start_codon:yes stop_codon:yes gene_type:complete